MKLQITTTVDVDWVENPRPVPPGSDLARHIEKSVAEAVYNILAQGQANGFSHEMEEEISILLDSEVQAKLV